MIEWVKKRDGRIVPFRAEKIADAIFAAAQAVGGEDRRQAEFLAGQVIHLLQQSTLSREVPQVEEIQDLVEKVLIEHGHARTAKAFILYRNQRTRIREAKSELMDVVSEIFQESGSEAQSASLPLDKLQRIASAASERYSLNNLLPREYALAHQRARIHIDRLAHYSTAVTAVSLDMKRPLAAGQTVGRVPIPPLRDLDDLAYFSAALVLAAQNEALEEVMLANVDAVFVNLCERWQQQPSQSEVQRLAASFLTAINLALATGAGLPAKICVSVGTAISPIGQLFTNSLLAALQEGQHFHTDLFLPQIVFQLLEGVNASPGDPGYELAQSAKQVAQQYGNLSFVYLANGEPSSHFLASGCRLEADFPVLIGRTFINMPRLVLEADTATGFYANVDAIFSLVARQMAHRYEVLTALKPTDLPLLGQQLGWTDDTNESLLKQGLLLLVPIGINDALRLAQLRFGNAMELTDKDFLRLLLEICEHWRNYYSLNLQIGVGQYEGVARRFFNYDASLFPLVNMVWPERMAYSDRLGQVALPPLPGGQLEHWLPTQALQAGAVLVSNHIQASCSSCGEVLAPGESSCPACKGEGEIRIVQRGGYLKPQAPGLPS
ncbi:MAG: hypothetical protein GX060_04445 [Firmicutes bacterium]|nr:hypothetical protein [Bacillota bacterium]